MAEKIAKTTTELQKEGSKEKGEFYPQKCINH